jgi:signal transduction histidine kinase
MQMNFKKKLFLAILIPSVLICGALLVFIHQKVSSSLRSEFTQRYETFNGVLARSLVQIEQSSDRSMLNAAHLFQRHEAEYPGVGTPGLKKLSQDIGASDVFVADQNGKFIRSTNDTSDGMPNLLSSCAGYGKLLGRSSAFGTSPVVSSPKDGLPYKTLVVPNQGGTRFLEVAYPADYIAKTILDAVNADQGIQAVSLFSADGTSLGEFGPGAATAPATRAPLAWKGQEGVDFQGDRAVFTKIVPLVDPNCCECKVIKAKAKEGYSYILQTSVSSAVLASSLIHLRMVMGVASGAAVAFALIFALLISYFLVARLGALRKAINGISSSDQVKIRVPGEGKDEIGALATAFNQMLERLDQSQAKFIRMEKAKLTYRMTSQVAQDIRSPLAAFNVLESDLSELPRERLQLLRSAINRVRDIANGLLNQRPDLEDSADTPRKGTARVQLVSSLLEPIVSEMRAHARSGVAIECGLDPKSYGWFAYLEAAEFQRVIADLVKHGIESADETGRVRIQLNRVEHDLLISVWDDGAALGTDIGGVSELALKHAQSCLEVWGGRLEIRTEAGVGTERRILLPVAEAPFWYVDRIEVPSNMTLAVLDDDVSIHQVWQRTFDAHLLKKNDCALVCFTTPEELSKWMAANPKRVRHTQYFIDYEFAQGMENGLEFIERHSIQSRSVLVTNRFEERSVIEVCARLRVKMIPKTMLGFVPVETSMEWRSPERIAKQPPTLEI